MTEYIRNILPRIQQYSKSLDHKENYVDKPWVFIDNNNSIHEYEFCRDGRLIMSLDGQVQFGRWEYRAATQRLLIERPTDAILLQNAFINDGLMILKKSASEDPAFILINQIVVPDLDYVSYLQRCVKAYTKAAALNRTQEPVEGSSEFGGTKLTIKDVATFIVIAFSILALIILVLNL